MRRVNIADIDADHFWARIDMSGDCWEAAIGTGHGYSRYKNYYAHHIAYRLVKGPVPAGLELDHLCRNRRCVRPDHLEAVPHRVNILRGATVPASRAARTHCPQGHPYDEANTYQNKGHRSCRLCRKAYQEEYWKTHDWHIYRQKTQS